MPERRRDRLKNWAHAMIGQGGQAPLSTAGPVSPRPRSGPPSDKDLPPPSGRFTIAGSRIDNIALALNLVQQVANIVQSVPFVAPAAALMSEILKVCKGVKDTNEKRDALLTNITDLTCDLCGTILRLEATTHVDLIGRLKADIEAYARLLGKASAFIEEYDNQSALTRFAAHNDLGSKFIVLNRELDSFSARFRTNRLVDLAIRQRANTTMLDKMNTSLLEGKLEKWLESPDVKQRQVDTEQLRTEGTGLWLLTGDEFIEWQDNPGLLWISGPSGAGKSVLSSAVISQLVADQHLFDDPKKIPALAFFYFDFRNSHTVEDALRRIILQLSAQSSQAYRALEEQYILKSKGQTLPTYQELQKLLYDLLEDFGRTYIVLDALDECKDSEHPRLVEFISRLQMWTQTPLHVLITSQPRRIFTEGFKDVMRIELKAHVTQPDIGLFVDNQLRALPSWTHRAANRIVNKSNGMFRLAACLILELSRCPWEDDLDQTLDGLPTDLFGIYDRFLQKILPEHCVYAQGVLKWILFSKIPLTLKRLADAVAFDFSDTTQFVYKPSRREGNIAAIPDWLAGLVTFSGRGVCLAHASVKEYLLSKQLIGRSCCDLSPSLSHTFLAQTCIGYLLHFSTHSSQGLPDRQAYPLATYAALYWCYHLLRAQDQSLLFSEAMRLLEEGSTQYDALLQLRWRGKESSLHLCCQEGYMEGVQAILATGVDINARSGRSSALYKASAWGRTDIVHLLLENGADVNAEGGQSGPALTAASGRGSSGIVRLLLENGANIDARDAKYGSALQAASLAGETDVVKLLLENGANVNADGGEFGSALKGASRKGYTNTVQLLLNTGADVNARGGILDTALQAASWGCHTEVVRLLLENGADVNTEGGNYGSALQAASLRGNGEIVQLLLEHGANVNSMSGNYGSALRAAACSGSIQAVKLLLDHGADVNAGRGCSLSFNALHAATHSGRRDSREIMDLLREKGATYR
ncbi:hypothetical protein DFH09DRAFT_1003879 [Mycena vulgaris]|nr:hypothetical protein DFH09DRAFT_1003879 [Mycena vulgaris]